MQHEILFSKTVSQFIICPVHQDESDQQSRPGSEKILTGIKFRVRNRKITFLHFDQNICCGYSKELSEWDRSFEHPKHMLKIMGKKISNLMLKIFVYLNLCTKETCWSGRLCAQFVCLVCLITSQINSYGHGGTVSSLNHTFSRASLNERLASTLCTYFRL